MPITLLRRKKWRRPQGRISPARSSLVDGLVLLQSAAQFARGNGSPTGITDLEPTPYGQGFRGGAGKYYSSPVQYAPTTASPSFSVAFEFVCRTAPAGTVGAFCFGNTAETGVPRLYFQCTASEKFNVYYGNAYRISGGAPLQPNERILLIFTHDGVTGRLFLNGVEFGAFAATWENAHEAANWYFGSGFGGQLDAVYLWQAQWSRGLRPEEAVKISANPAALFAARRRVLARAAGGALSLTGLTMSNPTASGARATLSITR